MTEQISSPQHSSPHTPWSLISDILQNSAEDSKV